MIEFDTTVRIDRARERVFAILTDFESNLARWAKGPVAATRTVGDGGVGTRYMITAKVGPVKVRSPYEVTGYDPPARFAGHGIAGPVRFHEEYALTADGPATILTQSIRAAPRGPFRLAGKTLRHQLQQLITSDLIRLKDLAEADIPQDSAHPRGRHRATGTDRQP
jgi:carbon monoxide dehydrogenase subunit G